ncbi:hypothetical protein HCA37_07995 [Listeria seeligeri]|uniref:restriction endonuclease subunit S n=1 Tax=Listeria seeligeri TaxID=1640 RepID=UPI0016237662|nr:restriction endonuclease subunit S [Listeria seeligeri]MBC1479712.1 hypothetical protein [Listeria seeligeri]MBC1790667.1 hypothetical protein [Listeria seeligeri]MBC1846826.1 hypothetical protein [Listeria seeligeri]
MSDSKKNAPKRRFEEFSNANDWEQRKLGDVSNYIKGFAFKSKDYKKDGVRIIQVSDLTKDKIKCSNTNIFVSLELAELNKKYRINKNEIIITTVGSKAEIKESAVGRPIIVAEEGHFLLNQNLVKLTSLQGFDNYFIYSQLLQPRYINYIAAIERGNANQANIAIIDLWQYTFLVPKKLEQQKISMFFKQLDNTIALHQRKLEKIKALKTAYLSEMFPAEGESKPKRRFAGFTDDWEQRKLGEVLDNQYNGQTPSRENDTFWKGSINWLSSGELNRAVVSETIEKITKAGQVSANLKMISKGTFVLAITGLEAAGTRGNCAILGVDTTLNQSCMALFPNEKKLDPSFLFQWYRKVGEEYGIRYTQGTKQQSYNAELIKILPIKLPRVNEQKQIVEFLGKLDNTITLHQRKLKKLQNIKKAYLNEMFI